MGKVKINARANDNNCYLPVFFYSLQMVPRRLDEKENSGSDYLDAVLASGGQLRYFRKSGALCLVCVCIQHKSVACIISGRRRRLFQSHMDSSFFHFTFRKLCFKTFECVRWGDLRRTCSFSFCSSDLLEIWKSRGGFQATYNPTCNLILSAFGETLLCAKEPKQSG